jgi:hypothetical protein
MGETMKTKSAKFMILTMMVMVTTLIFAQTVFAGAPPAPYFNGFETDISGWDVSSNNPIRISSGTNGIPASAGDWYAQTTTANQTPFTRWGGYSSIFPSGGYSTLIDIYLDVNGVYANDLRFDFTSAISTPANGHRRDFAFNAGFYNDAIGPGAGSNRFVISASNNTGRENSFPKNPGRDPISITQSGWYTFKHTFYDNGSGVLAVDLIILDSSETVLKTWTLSDPTDLIGSTVGGNRYGWFAANDFAFLAFDNSKRTGVVPNELPTADPGGPYVGAINTSIYFDGIGSTDPDGNPLTYAWEFGDATTGTGGTPSHIYNAAGIYDVCLTVNDGFVDSAEVCTYAVVYDPTGGFVTGGGWIDSPAAQTTVAFSSIPDPLPGNLPSQPYQAQQTAEFGDHIRFAGTDRDLSSVTVTMSSWAKHSEYPLMPAGGFTHPLTLNIYGVDNSGATPALGSLITSVTQDFQMQWRPEADPTCSGGTAWRAADGTCYNGFAFNIVFDLRSEGSTLPDEIIYGIASNTQTWGYAPIGAPGPYNSLNFALNTASGPSTGTDVEPDAVFWNTKTAAWYSDGGAAGIGTFRRDTGWTGYVPAVRFSVTSPGAYKLDPTLGGKATFGFVSKYKRGATVPDGNTEFQFKAGNLNFSSTSYQWLVVNQAGTNAQFKGYGTINGAGNYGFMLSATDSSPDTFRIQIWDAETEVVVYDNGTNQVIGGGSIVVHKK